MRLLTLTLPAAVLASGPGWTYDYGNDHACPLASYFGVPSCTKADIAAEDAEIDTRWDALTSTSGDNDCVGYYQSPISIPIPRMVSRDFAADGRVAVNANQGAGTGAVVPTANNVKANFVSEAVTVTIPTGNNLKMNFPADANGVPSSGNNFTLPSGGVYKPAQFHWHYPSEMTWQDSDGTVRGYAGELHVVHVRTTDPPAAYAYEKPYLVLNAFLTLSSLNIQNDILTRQLAGNGEITNFDLLDDDTFGQIWNKGYYRFQGGLTTPPCSEAVEWFVFEEPYVIREASWKASNFTAAEITDNSWPECNQFTGCTTSIFGNPRAQAMDDLQSMRNVANRLNRPTQPINGRKILKNTLTSVANDLTIGDKYNVKKAWNCTAAIQSPVALSTTSAVKCAGSEAYQATVSQKRGSSEVAFGDVETLHWTFTPAFAKGYMSSNTRIGGATLTNTGYGFTITQPQMSSVYQIAYPAGRAPAGLRDITFRFPAEHTIDGVRFDGEIILTHTVTALPADDHDDDHDDHRMLAGGGGGGSAAATTTAAPPPPDVEYVVIAIPMKAGVTGWDALNRLGFRSLDGVFLSAVSGMPMQKDSTSTIDAINLSEIFPQNSADYLEYTGSLTSSSDDCSKTAKQFILKNPITVNQQSIDYWYQNFGKNNRPIQGDVATAGSATTTTAAAHRQLSAATTTAAAGATDYSTITVSMNGYSAGAGLAATSEVGGAHTTGCAAVTESISTRPTTSGAFRVGMLNMVFATVVAAVISML